MAIFDALSPLGTNSYKTFFSVTLRSEELCIRLGHSKLEKYSRWLKVNVKWLYTLISRSSFLTEVEIICQYYCVSKWHFICTLRLRNDVYLDIYSTKSIMTHKMYCSQFEKFRVYIISHEETFSDAKQHTVIILCYTVFINGFV